MAYYNGKKLPSVVMVHGAAEEPVLIEKTVTENGEYSAAADGADGYSKFTANVPVPEGYVIPEGDVEITENGTHDVSGKATATVNVAGGAELNIAYGETAPTDTSKLWVSGAEPSKVSTAFNVSGEEGLTAGVGALPTAATGISVASASNKVYLFGGHYGSTSYLSTINCFDTETNSVSSLTSLPDLLAYSAAASIGGKIYLFGGGEYSNYRFNYSDYIYCYDIETNTRTILTTRLPTEMAYTCVGVVGNKVYIIGGKPYASAIYMFNTETNAISTMSAVLPTEAYGFGCAAVGTKIYLFGGQSSDGRLSTIICYDTKTDTISTLSATLPVAANNIGAIAYGTKIYLFGGSGADTSLSTINCFDTEKNTIETISTILPTAAYNIGVASVGANIYLFGGNTGSTKLSTINLFSLAFDLPTDNLLLHLSATDNLFKLINADTASIEVGLQGVYRGNADGVGEMETAYLHDGTDWVEV